MHEVFGFFITSDGETESCQSFTSGMSLCLTGTVRFFCCFFDRRLAVVPSIALAPISEHLNKLFTISSWIFPERKPRELTATPCPGKDAIVSCSLISELQEACCLAGISLFTHVGKEETLRKQKWTPHLFNTTHAGPIYNKLRT